VHHQVALHVVYQIPRRIEIEFRPHANKTAKAQQMAAVFMGFGFLE